MALTKLHQLQDVHVLMNKFEKMQTWIYNDLKNSTIMGHANLLVAMGLFNYTEILGGYYRYSSSKARFNFVINQLMPKPYKSVCNKIDKLTTKGSYDTLRCGMTHEYLIKTRTMKDSSISISFTIYGSVSEEDFTRVIESEKCGLKIIKKSPTLYHLQIINARYIYDLFKAFDLYKKRVLSDKYGYRAHFLSRAKEVGLRYLN
jgi:hypothetical protein